MADEQAAPKDAPVPDSEVNVETPVLGSNEKAENGNVEGQNADITNGWKKPEAYDYSAFHNDQQQQQWGSAAAVYEWDGEEGDIGPVHPELEREIFGDEEVRKDVQGIDFTKVSEVEVVQEGPVKVEPITSFATSGLHPAMLRNIELCGYGAPTPIQKFTLPAIHCGYDTIGIAQTGSGKTAAFLIPILNKLMGKAKKLAAPRPNPVTYQEGIDPPVRAEPLVVIIVPARELAIQIFSEARKFCYRTMLRPCVCYGGGPISEQMKTLGRGCDVLIATPGRLVDFMHRPHVLTFKRLRYMVIDEADEMLQQDWEQEMGQIMTGGDQDEGRVKYMLFSATFPKPLRDLARAHLSEDHVRFRVGRAGSTSANIKQYVIKVEPHLKKPGLLQALDSMPPCRTIIFVNSKRTADEIDDFLYNMGLPCTSMHSDRTQLEREASMRAFKAGTAPILVATGVTARGIDVRNVMHVINYDLPTVDFGGIEEYTHRIGRTGRIGHRGLATSFFTEEDEPLASVLTRTMLEAEQDIPNFLQEYIPEDADKKLKFEADSDFEDEDGLGGGSGGDAWGGNSGNNDATQTNDQDWGNNAAEPSKGDASGWGSEAPASNTPETGGPGWGVSDSAAQGASLSKEPEETSGWGASSAKGKEPEHSASGWGGGWGSGGAVVPDW